MNTASSEPKPGLRNIHEIVTKAVMREVFGSGEVGLLCSMAAARYDGNLRRYFSGLVLREGPRGDYWKQELLKRWKRNPVALVEWIVSRAEHDALKTLAEPRRPRQRKRPVPLWLQG